MQRPYSSGAIRLLQSVSQRGSSCRIQSRQPYNPSNWVLADTYSTTPPSTFSGTETNGLLPRLHIELLAPTYNQPTTASVS